MLHVLVIVMLAAIATHDAFARDGGAYALYASGASAWWTVPVVSVPMLVLVVMAWLVCRAAGSMVDHGRLGGIAVAERTGTAVRIAAVGLHVANVLVFGWLDVVRSVIGDVIVLDEVVSIAPPLLVFCGTWAAVWPLEKRARDAVTIRGLDSGMTLYPMPTRRQFVVSHLRHQVLLSLIPIMMLLGWAECAEWAADWLSRQRGTNGAGGAATGLLAWLGAMARDPSTRSGGLLAVQFVGVAIVLSIAPLALRFVWDTVKLSPGPLRDRLVGMCRQHAVGVRELLVWRTHGAMINGAVMGLWGRLRYILLTDALLDSLPRHQVEAVMAHELGHVRHKHVPWLAAVMITSLLGLSMLGTMVLWAWALVAMPEGPDANVVEAATFAIGAVGVEVFVGIALLAGTIMIFAFVSRRFEWQADAFAAMHLSMPGSLAGEEQPSTPGSAAESRVASDAPPAPGLITPGGVAAMAGALVAVSRLNNIPLDRGGFRHGSLALRIRKLRALAGIRLDALPIDRTVRRIKLATLVAAVAVGGLMAAAAWFGF